MQLRISLSSLSRIARAAVVEHDDDELLGAVVALVGRPAEPRDVARQLAADGGERQLLDHERGIGGRLEHALEACEHHVAARHRRDEAAVALVLEHDHGAALGDHEVGAGDAHVGLEEDRAQLLARVRDHARRVVGHRAAAVHREELGDLTARAVDGRREDVRRTLARELHEPLAEIGLDRRQARGLERVVELDLLGDHRLALGDHLRRRARCAISSTARTASAGVAARITLPPRLMIALLEPVDQLGRARDGGRADGPGAVDALGPVGMPLLDRAAEVDHVPPRGLQRGRQARDRRAPCRGGRRAPCRRRRRRSRRPALALEQLGQRRRGRARSGSPRRRRRGA